MSLASDTALLYSQGFVVDTTTGQRRIVRIGVDHGPIPHGDLGPVDGVSGLTTATAAAVTIVAAQLADEASRVALGNVVFGAPLSWNPHGSGSTQYV
jgi:hypothetical protein